MSEARFDFFDIDLDRYSDAPWDREVDVAVSALTSIGVLRGNDDGTFRPSRTLNRAEFITIVMRLIDDNNTVNTNCFPDVRPSDWFAEDVCRAKALGIVRGNAKVGVSEDMWRFEPSRDVQFEEAVKVLVKMYALPVSGDEEGADWYVPFIEAAEDADLTISGLEPGDRITRGEMARLTIAFVADNEDMLIDLRDAEENDEPTRSSSSSHRSSESSRSSRSSSRMSNSSSTSHNGSGIFDPLTDNDVRSNVLVLGQTSTMIAGVKFFSNAEPVMVDEIEVNFSGDPGSISQLLIYDTNGEQLGVASGVGGGTSTFRASIPEGRMELPRREDKTIYVRARLKDPDNGGDSGDVFEVNSVTLEGTGIWSNDEYTTTSSDDFPAFATANGKITGVTNIGLSNSVLVNGSDQEIGNFRFNATSPDPDHDVRLTQLTFDVQSAGNVTLSDLRLRHADSGAESTCSLSSAVITCGSIPESVGIVDDVRELRLYADVSVSGSNNQTLRIVLNDPGSPDHAGDLQFSDGETTFNWIGGNEPIVRGTLFE